MLPQLTVKVVTNQGILTPPHSVFILGGPNSMNIRVKRVNTVGTAGACVNIETPAPQTENQLEE